MLSFTKEPSTLCRFLEQYGPNKSEFFFSFVFKQQEYLEKNKESFLHEREIILYNSFKFTARKKSYLIGRYAAKKALSFLFDEPVNKLYIGNGALGEPLVFGNINACISLSHSGEYAVACACQSTSNFGIDIELLKNIFDIDTASFFTYEKSHLIDDWKSKYGEGVLKAIMWSSKEALSKALKCGLTISMKTLDISTIEGVSRDKFLVKFDAFSSYHAVVFLRKKTVISFCYPSKNLAVFSY